MNRRAFTQIELLVSLAVIALLLALLLPAVQSVRAAARRAQCASNLRQIGVAVAAYESAHGMFPPGSAFGASLHVSLLTFIDQRPLFEKYDFINRDDAAVLPVSVPLYWCPSDDTSPRAGPGFVIGAVTSYAGNAGTGVFVGGYNGMFRHLQGWTTQFPEGPIRAVNVRNGLSQTAAIAEILVATGGWDRLRANWRTPEVYSMPGDFEEFVGVCDSIPARPADFGWTGSPFARGLPWTKGELGWTMYNHVLPPNRPSCLNAGDVQSGIYTAASQHPGGVNLLFGDGHLNFVSDSVDRSVWRQLGARVDSDFAN